MLMMNDDNLKTLARQKKHKHRRCAQIRLCKDLSTQNKFLHKCFCAQRLLHKRFYAQKLIHADAFTHRKINPETSQFCTHTHTDAAFTFRRFYTMMLINTGTVVGNFYTQNTFTHMYDFYTHAFLHIKKITRKTRNIFLTRKTITHKTCDAQNLLHTELRHTSTFTFDTQVPLTTGTFTQK